MANVEEETVKLLCNLQQVFRDGYRPARGLEHYDYTLKNKAKLYSIVNCFGHIFNLQNQQFNDYKFTSFPMFGSFSGMRYDSKEKALQRMLDFIQATGLKIEECDPKKPIEDFKSWKIALYFEEFQQDFHYLLEEQPQLWSSKIGFEPCLEHIYSTTPPTTYRNLVDNDALLYNFYGTYKITNPNANANNRYLKNFKFNTTGLKTFPLQKQYVIEDARKNTIDSLMDGFEWMLK